MSRWKLGSMVSISGFCLPMVKNSGKPYGQMDDLGGSKTPLFSENSHIYPTKREVWKIIDSNHAFHKGGYLMWSFPRSRVTNQSILPENGWFFWWKTLFSNGWFGGKTPLFSETSIQIHISWLVNLPPPPRKLLYLKGNQRSCWRKGNHLVGKPSSWWFQPIWKIWVKMGIFPNFRGEHKKSLKPIWKIKKGDMMWSFPRSRVTNQSIQIHIWATKKKPDYFPLNPGWLIRILISWFMK